MADMLDIGWSVASFQDAPALGPISKVTLIVGEDDDTQSVYTAGDDTGRELEAACPWGTQAAAEYILSVVSGYEYKPYEATGALVDPAAELGDGIGVHDITSIIASQSIEFSSLCACEISAPYDEEMDHEYPYESSSNREIKRRIADTKASLKLTNDAIETEVTRAKGEEDKLSSQITQTAESIKLSVSSKNGKTTFTLTGDGISAEAKNIELTVDSAKINGKLSANQLETDQLIVGENIKMGENATISWNNVTEQPTIPTTTSQLSNNSGFIDSSQATIITESTVTATYVNGLDVTAKNIRGQTVYLYDQNGNQSGTITISPATYSTSEAIAIKSDKAARFVANGGNLFLASNGGYIQLSAASGSYVQCNNNFIPVDDSTSTSTGQVIGGVARRWRDIYCRNSSINTSDQTEKKDIEYGIDRYNSFFDGLKPCTFKFIGAHERTHFGMIAQDVEKLIEECGMTSMDVAAFIKSEKENGEGYIYGLRYGEFISLLIDQVQTLKKRVEELEKKGAAE